MALTKVIGSGIDTVFVDAGNNKIGINTNAPNRMLGIENGDVQIHETGSSDPLLQFSVGNTQASPTQSYSLRIDNSDSDKFQLINGTSGEIALSVDTTGAVTKPLQPAFNVTMSSNSAQFGAGTLQPNLDTEIFDQNADFSSNTFTAPVTGRYFLSWMVYAASLDTGASYYYNLISTSNRNYTKYLYTASFASDVAYYGWSVTALADMDANDTAQFYLAQVGGHSTSQVFASETRAMGYLVC